MVELLAVVVVGTIIVALGIALAPVILPVLGWGLGIALVVFVVVGLVRVAGAAVGSLDRSARYALDDPSGALQAVGRGAKRAGLVALISVARWAISAAVLMTALASPFGFLYLAERWWPSMGPDHLAARVAAGDTLGGLFLIAWYSICALCLYVVWRRLERRNPRYFRLLFSDEELWRVARTL